MHCPDGEACLRVEVFVAFQYTCRAKFRIEYVVLLLLQYSDKEREHRCADSARNREGTAA